MSTKNVCFYGKIIPKLSSNTQYIRFCSSGPDFPQSLPWTSVFLAPFSLLLLLTLLESLSPLLESLSRLRLLLFLSRLTFPSLALSLLLDLLILSRLPPLQTLSRLPPLWALSRVWLLRPLFLLELCLLRSLLLSPDSFKSTGSI